MTLRLRFLIGLLVILLLIGAWWLVALALAWAPAVRVAGVWLIGALGVLGLASQLNALLRRQIEQLRAWLLDASVFPAAEMSAPPDVSEELLPLVTAGEHLLDAVRALAAADLRHQHHLEAFARSLEQFGRGLPLERDLELLLERILLEAKALCHADAATLYLRTEADALAFAIVRNDTLGLAYGGSSGVQPPYPPLRLRPGPNDRPGYGRHIASQVALSKRISNIPQHNTVSFIAGNYLVNSLLTVPLLDSRGEVLGVLQLINAQDPLSGERVPFDVAMERMVTSLAVLAAALLETWPYAENAESLPAS